MISHFILSSVQVDGQIDRSGLMSVMPKFLVSKFDSDISSSSSSDSDTDDCCSDKLRRGSLKTWDADVQVMLYTHTCRGKK